MIEALDHLEKGLQNDTSEEELPDDPTEFKTSEEFEIIDSPTD